MNQFTLKLVAVASMLYDHVLRMFGAALIIRPLEHVILRATEQFPDAAGAFAALYHAALTLLPFPGRIAAPIFMFMIATGYTHTRSVSRYAARLFGFAILAQLPYALFFLAYMDVPLAECQLNFMFTLGIGLLAVWGWEHPLAPRGLGEAQLTGWRVLTAGLFLLPAGLASCEGGYGYAALVPVFYLTRGWGAPDHPVFPGNRGRWSRLALFGLLYSLMELRSLTAFWGQSGALESFALYAVGPCVGVWLCGWYNGLKGGGGRAAQYLMYAFYPTHFLVLALLGLLLPG